MSELSSEQIREVGEISEEELAELREEHEELEDLISVLSGQDENFKAIAHHIEEIENDVRMIKDGQGYEESARANIAKRVEKVLKRFDRVEEKLEQADRELRDIIEKTQQTEEIMRNEVTVVEQ